MSLAAVSFPSPVPYSSHAAHLGSGCKFPPQLQRSGSDLKHTNTTSSEILMALDTHGNQNQTLPGCASLKQLMKTAVRGHRTSGVRVDPGGSRVNLQRTAIKHFGETSSHLRRNRQQLIFTVNRLLLLFKLDQHQIPTYPCSAPLRFLQGSVLPDGLRPLTAEKQQSALRTLKTDHHKTSCS